MAKAIKVINPGFVETVRVSFAKQGLMGTYGAWLVSIAPGAVTIEVPHNMRLTQQQGFFHGGVVAAVADAAGGYAALTMMPERSEVLTVEYKVNFMRPALGPLLRATGTVIRSGKTLTVARMDVVCGQEGSLETCAVVQATFMRIDIA